MDSFKGQFAEGPTIWQCKSFPTGIRKPQKQQIKFSLKRALRHSPRRWILCLSIDMGTQAHRWFQRLKQSYTAKVNIGLFQASDIIHELIHRRTLRNHYFPNAALDPIELKRVLRQTGELSQAELERVTQENVQDFLERLKERDARFNYEVVFGGDRGPVQPQPVPGMMFSLSDGTKQIQAFARDVDALKSDPPTVSLQIKGTGVSKFLSMIKTGQQQEFMEGELGNLKSNIGLMPVLQPGTFRLKVGPSANLRQGQVKAKLTVRNGPEAVEYGFIEFETVRAGTNEAELKSRGNLPFEMSLVVVLDSRTGRLTLRKRFIDADVRQVCKFMRALRLLQNGGEFEMFDLEHEKVLFRAKPALDEWKPEDQEFGDLMETLSRIAERFGVDLALPENIANEDWAAIVLLKRYIHRESVNADNFRVVLEKSEANAETVPSALTSEMSLQVQREYHEPKPTLFGHEINTGPCAIRIRQAEVKDLVGFIERFGNAEVGAGVELCFKPISPVEFAQNLTAGA